MANGPLDSFIQGKRLLVVSSSDSQIMDVVKHLTSIGAEVHGVFPPQFRANTENFARVTHLDFRNPDSQQWFAKKFGSKHSVDGMILSPGIHEEGLFEFAQICTQLMIPSRWRRMLLVRSGHLGTGLEQAFEQRGRWFFGEFMVHLNYLRVDDSVAQTSINSKVVELLAKGQHNYHEKLA